MDIDELAGVGAKSAALFRELGVRSARDLLEYLPFRYDDLRFPTSAAALGTTGNAEENAVGVIDHVAERRVRDLEIVEVRMHDASGSFTAKWLGRRRFVIGRFREGMRLFVRGRIDSRTLAGAVINVSQYATLAEGETYRGEMLPIYRASKDLTTRKIASVVAKNLPHLLEFTGEDLLPLEIASSRGYGSLRETFRAAHAPTTPEEAARARERFIFTEFLALAAATHRRRIERERDHNAPRLRVPETLLAEFEAQLPFSPTTAQRRVIAEIWDDMTHEVAMNRLLQGDVGSGKTLVAAAAILLAARNGAQSALMAPTEILAAQHAAKLAPLLMPFGIAVEAVFGSQPARAREGAVNRIASGEAHLAVGTHALLTENVAFARLGLVIIDEQHRFGVEHRAKLRAKGNAPHTLHMTATPIPRTLAQSIYADLDTSTLDELPPGRTAVETFAVRAARLNDAYTFVRRIVAQGHQAYIIAPAIDENEDDLTSAVAEAERLKSDVFADLRVGLLHGRLPGREKDAVMTQFARGELDVMVATTVVEVGVDVSNASLMVVLDAQRYGLAQLHQLRGRIGRGATKSYCILVYPEEGAETARLSILTRTRDGFAIADEDLKLRGPGQFSGTAQSGDAGLRFGDLLTDLELYREAREAAERVLAADPDLSRPQNAGLRSALAREPSTRALGISS